MPDLLKEARKAARRGDHSRAGDLYDLAGRPHDAIQCYLEGNHYLLAAQVAARIGELTDAASYFATGGDFIQSAELYFKSGQRRKATVMYERAGQYLRAAEVEEGMGNLGVAAAHYETAGQLEKAAYLYARVGSNLKAAELYEALIRSSKNDTTGSGVFGTEDTRKTTARYARFSGILHFKAGQFAQAGPRLEEAGLYEQAVDAYRKAGQTSRAAELLVRLENYVEALRIVEEDPAASVDGRMLGELLLRAGQYERAAETFLREKLVFKAAECFESAGDLERAAELFASEGEHIRGADLFAAIGKHAEAARTYERGGELTNAASAFITAGLPEEAVRAYLAAGKPSSAAELLLERGEEEEAIRLLQHVKAGEPEYAKASFLLGTIFSKQELHTLALEKFEVALGRTKDETERARCLYYKGLAYEQMGRIEEARTVYERVLSIDYHHADVAKRVRLLVKRIPAASPGAGAGGPRQLTPTPIPAMTAAGEKGVGGLGDTTPVESRLVPDHAVTSRLDFVRTIGRGRLGEILEAYDRALHRRVAVRKFPPSSGQADMYGRLLKEAERSRELIHPNMATVFGIAEDAAGRYVISEMVEGRTLREILDEKVRLEPAKVMNIAQQAADILAHAHKKGLLHRDLRPENLFIVNEDTLKVCDFGMKARFSDSTEQRGASLCYASPELIRGERVDARSDIYALGIILYELLMGEPPFPPETAYFDHLNTPPSYPQKVDRILPAFLKKVISKCLEKDPGRRYRSAGVLLDDLRASGIVPGVIIADRYEILREIGIGGMGRVYQALDRDLDEVLAIKVLRMTDVEGKQLERFLREIKLARRITHENVVKVFDLGTWREHKYITMEFIDGVNLEQWRRLEPSMEIPAAAGMMVDVARALDSAHRIGIIHRDIKPQNILIEAGNTPKILDFGIARSSGGGADLTTAGFVMGSPKYMSPEQVQAHPLDARTDIYSLGVVMYFVFTGREPFVGETATGIAYRQLHERPRPPRELNADIPEWLDRAILKAMEKNAEDRFNSMADLATALEAGLAVYA